MSTKTGTVKFYLREKGYGFLQEDNNPNVDLFVHRNSIPCSPPLPENFHSTRWPYLKQGERVRFDTVTDSATGREQAVQVMWMNGDPIPPERTNYLGGVHERTMRILGQEVYELLGKSSDKSDEELAKEVRVLHESALASIQNAETFVRKLGMDPSMMPTVKSGVGRGKYFFSKEEAEAATAAKKGSPTTTTSTTASSDTPEETSVVSEDQLMDAPAESSMNAPATEVAPFK